MSHNSDLTNGSGRSQVSQTVVADGTQVSQTVVVDLKSHKREVSQTVVTELRSLTNGSVRTQVSQTEVMNCEVSQTNSSPSMAVSQLSICMCLM
jgi:hypothetical protein